MTDQIKEMDIYNSNYIDKIDTIDTINTIDIIKKLNKLDHEYMNCAIASLRECCNIENFNKIKKWNEELENFIIELQKKLVKNWSN
jgi:hypothetical protein